jgi:hypothetical protein
MVIAAEPHVPPKWDGRKTPSRSAPVGDAEQLAAEADGERLDLYADPATGQKMTELVDEHDHGDDREKSTDVEQESTRH